MIGLVAMAMTLAISAIGSIADSDSAIIKNTINLDINRHYSIKWKDAMQGNAWLKAGRDHYDASFARPLDKIYYGEDIFSCNVMESWVYFTFPIP